MGSPNDPVIVKIATPAPRVVEVIGRGPQGAPGAGTIDFGSGLTAVNVLAVADTALYTTVADFIPLGFSVRINTVTSFVSVPQVGLKINGGATIFGSGPIFGTDVADEVWVSWPTGMRPLVPNGQQIDFVVGTAGSANIGKRYAMFEAIHGSAPRMVSEGRAQYADPASMIRAAGMLVRHLGYEENAAKLEMALDICGQFEKKIQVTGRDTGATGQDYADYIMATVQDPELKARWESFQP